nr:immunoglobulin light chain junction region [Macaca mulatta]MOV78262.1 immunoglobulin light chain junction region [Macaca mulatta]MOV78397.1 immunoglobulin light chain junction region [Macaca mulatta]MOV78686.1 immunoglobulin light chain junction region [Macaca mulatta]MOV80735.1 immunoglobulin light chain junction region [Macaca mulatta]
CMQPLDFPWTF